MSTMLSSNPLESTAQDPAQSMGGLELLESTIEGSILVLILFISFNADVPEDAENIERNEHEQSGIGDSILQEKADNDPFREVSAENMPAKRNRGPISCPECQLTCKNSYLLRKHMSSKHKDTSQNELQCPYCLVVFDSRRSKAGHMRHCKAMSSREK